MLPPIVPRFRTWTSAIWAQTSPRIGRARASGEAISSRVGRHRADLERAVGAELDPLQLRDPVQVDEHVGRRGARLHHVDQGLAAGQGARAVVLRENPECLLERVRLRVPHLAQQHGGNRMRRRRAAATGTAGLPSRPRARVAGIPSRRPGLVATAKKFGGVAPVAVERFFADQCAQHAAAIAYRVLFSIVPLAIVLVSIFGLVLQNDERPARRDEDDRRRAAGLGGRPEGRRGRAHRDRDAGERRRARQPGWCSPGRRPG